MDILSINLNLLKSFWAVYKTGGVNRAARMLDIAAPAVTYNIKQLEKQMGIKLFNAHKHGVDPTSDASAIYPMIETAIESLLKCNEQFNNPTSGTIKIGLTTLHASFFCVAFTTAFRKSYPDIKLEFYHHPQHDYLTMLENDEIEVAIHFQEPRPSVVSAELMHKEMTFFTTKQFAAQHGLGDAITLEQIRTLPLVQFSMKEKSTLNQLEGCYGKGLNIVEAPSTHAAFAMAMAGLGIGYFFSEYLDVQNNDNIVKLRVIDAPEPTTRTYSYAHKQKPSALAALFIKELRHHYGLDMIKVGFGASEIHLKN
jgi:DNA-binding transcriptional LysR family regulator